MSLSIFIEDEKTIYNRIFLNIIGKEDNLEDLYIEYDFNLNKEFRVTTKFGLKEEKLILNFSNLVSSRTTLLTEACKSNSIKAVKFLLENNVNINYQEPYLLLTPIMFTIRKHNHTITKMILDTNRYDVFLKNRLGERLLEYTFSNGYTRKKKKYTFSALVILVSKYVLKKGICLEERDSKDMNMLDWINFQIDNYFSRDINELNKLKNFYEIYNENFKKKKFPIYPSSLKNNIIYILIINNKDINRYYLPIELWLYIFNFIRLIDYY